MSKVKLPNRILPIKNKDKGFHEKWKEGRNKLNVVHPFRILALGPPGSGKSTIAKNILLRVNPPFEKVFIIHCDPDYTQEYDDIAEGTDLELLSEIPPPESWEGKVKTLVILDDLEFKGMSKDQKRNLDRLFGYVSTHKNISIILCSQDFHGAPTIVRRCANMFILWKTPDLHSMATVASKTGLRAEDFHELFTLCKNSKDSIWIDLTENTPYPLRLNGFEVINKD